MFFVPQLPELSNDLFTGLKGAEQIWAAKVVLGVWGLWQFMADLVCSDLLLVHHLSFLTWKFHSSMALYR